MVREGRQDEEKEMSLTTKLKKEAEELEEIRETIEQLEKGLENPSKVGDQYRFFREREKFPRYTQCRKIVPRKKCMRMQELWVSMAISSYSNVKIKWI